MLDVMVSGGFESRGVFSTPSLITLLEGWTAEGGTAKTPPRTLVNSGVGCLVSRRQSGDLLAASLVLVIRPPVPLIFTIQRVTEKGATTR